MSSTAEVTWEHRRVVNVRWLTDVSILYALHMDILLLLSSSFIVPHERFHSRAKDILTNHYTLLYRFLHNTITTNVTPWPTLLPTILLNLRIALFPFNSRGPPPPPPPSPEEQLKIRRRAAEAVLSLIPKPVARVYFASSLPNNSNSNGKEDNANSEEEGEEIITQLEEILDIFGNAYLNKHLVYNILELVVVRLVPEMGECTTAELLAERGVLVKGQEQGLEGNWDGIEVDG